ncbi:3-dehydroquinate synthase [Alteribacter aurantiacus]|uniref:3-dehydroquinate synthase n=1 Tax=Alteribacter aurantiacus TaxID=254410 RepID=UPI0004104E0F|nr:3-dehydroquinate synthase [Alteribacter aurantiacus]
MSLTFDVRASTHSYPIVIEPGVRHRLGERLVDLSKEYSTCLIITDSNVANLYLDEVKQSFKANILSYTVPAGEGSKDMKTYEQVLSFALENGLDRNSLMIALGGGVVGDLAGFVAATYMRGIDFVQVPTTLLAHDSSVGGKTGINLPGGKNMVGAFHAPRAVFFDPEIFYSLPQKEWRSGLAEVLKHGLIYDYSLFTWIEENVRADEIPDTKILTRILERSIKVKKTIVEDDEKEKGVRAFLNFGHTLGHAIESEAGYGKWTHGEAVVIGMVFALRLSERRFNINLDSRRIEDVFKKLGYKTNVPHTMSTNRLIEKMKSDKKGNAGRIRFVLLEALEKPSLEIVEENDLQTLLNTEG